MGGVRQGDSGGPVIAMVLCQSLIQPAIKIREDVHRRGYAWRRPRGSREQWLRKVVGGR